MVIAHNGINSNCWRTPINLTMSNCIEKRAIIGKQFMRSFWIPFIFPSNSTEKAISKRCFITELKSSTFQFCFGSWQINIGELTNLRPFSIWVATSNCRSSGFLYDLVNKLLILHPLYDPNSTYLRDYR